MASNYEVNIKLNTRAVNKQLNNLEKRISKLNKLAQGGKANRAVNKREKERLNEAVKLTRQEQRTLRIKQKQLKVDQQQLKVEQQTANAINKQISGGGAVGKTGGGAARGSSGSGVLSSAVISGAFPLLFGQGPITAAAGAIGGGFGARFGGQMGGFAGGLAATSIATLAQNAVTGVSNLGKALNPLTADLNKLSTAVGIVGTEEGRRIKLIEQLSGKQAALAAVTQQMTQVVGAKGVKEIQKFSESFTALGNSFQRVLLRAGAGLAEFGNKVLGLLPGGTPKPPEVSKAVQSDRIVKDLTDKINKLELDIANQKIDQSSRLFPKPFGGLFPSQLPSLDDQVNEAKLKQTGSDQLKNLRDQLEARKKIVEAQELSRLKSLNNLTQADLLLKTNLDNIQVLEDTLEVGRNEALVRQKVRELAKEIGVEEAKTQEARIRSNLENERAFQRQVELVNTIEQSFKSAFKEAITGATSFGQTMSNILNNISNKLIDMAIDQAFSGGLLSSVLGMFGGNKNKNNGILNSPVNPFFFMAEGGPVNKGGSFIVGEKGPELFVPSKSGTIIPNHALGGSTNVVVNVDASGSSVQGDDQSATKLGELIGAAVQSEIVKQKMDGGLLS